MRKHPELGKDLLVGTSWFEDAIPVVLHHHERFDGSGYPAHLAAHAIPLNARLFAVIDVFDALLTVRPYKEAFLLDKALSILEEGRDSHFDPEVVKAFVPLAPIFFDTIYGRTETELKALLEGRRKKIIGA